MRPDGVDEMDWADEGCNVLNIKMSARFLRTGYMRFIRCKMGDGSKQMGWSLQMRRGTGGPQDGSWSQPSSCDGLLMLVMLSQLFSSQESRACQAAEIKLPGSCHAHDVLHASAGSWP